LPYCRWLDILWWDVKNAFLQEWRLWKANPFPTFHPHPELIGAAKDWSWQAEIMAERFVPITFNAGTDKNPEWVCLR